jgi:hypothetical protein
MAPWWLFALLASVADSACYILNERFKLNGYQVIFYQSSFAVLVLLPALPFIGLPTNPLVYLMALACGVGVAIGGSMLMTSSARYGAGVTTRLLPMAILVNYVMWFGVHPTQLMDELSQPARFAGVTLALIGCALALAMMRKNPINRAAMVYLLPAVVLMSAVWVMNKMAQDRADSLIQGVVVFTILFRGVAALFSAGVLVGQNRALHRPKVDFLSPVALKLGAILGVFYTIDILLWNAAMGLAANSAFVVAVGMSLPLWVFLWNRWNGIPDSSDLKAGFLFVASTIALILVAKG